jgi:hypothetical protein
MRVFGDTAIARSFPAAMCGSTVEFVSAVTFVWPAMR